METWLTIDEAGYIFRHNKYGDEKECIGCILWLETSPDNKWFKIFGDNKTLSKSELEQILEWVNDWKYE